MSNPKTPSKVISWTIKELQVWIGKGLIDPRLLLHENLPNLHQFIADNKESLYKHYHDQIGEFPYQVEIPPPEKLHNTYELHIVDKTTGKTVKILEQTKRFELLDGLSLKVKAKEIDNWREQTTNLEKLSKGQIKTFKNVLESLTVDGKKITIDQINKLIEEVLLQDKPTFFPLAGHLIDQKVPTQETVSFQQKIKIHGLRGLSIGEHKIIKTIGILHHTYHGPKIENVFGLSLRLISNASLEKTYGFPPSIIMIDEEEYYKTYWGSSNFGGSDRKLMKKQLDNFASKTFTITRKSQENGEIHTIEVKTPMIEVAQHWKEPITGKKVKRLKKQLIICMSQIFTDQIKEKYINYPVDINPKLDCAAGGGKAATNSMHLMLDYFQRDISNKRWLKGAKKPGRISQKKLITMLELEKLNKNRLNVNITKCINTMKNLGILDSWKKTTTKAGEIMYEYYLIKIT